MIDLIGSKIKNPILDLLRKYKYYSIILDCTPDVSHTEQLSVILRFVLLNELTKKIEIWTFHSMLSYYWFWFIFFHKFQYNQKLIFLYNIYIYIIYLLNTYLYSLYYIICINQRTTSLISPYESTTRLLSSKQNLFKKIISVFTNVCLILKKPPKSITLSHILNFKIILWTFFNWINLKFNILDLNI